MHSNERICVVLVIDDLGYGGAERQVVELANNLDRNRFDVHVCSLSDHIPLSAMFSDAECRLHTIVRMTRFDFTVIPRLACLLRRLQADIVHGFLFSAEIASRLAGCLARTKVVIGSERNANHVMKRSNWIAYRFTCRCVDVIIANSGAGAEWNSRVFARPLSDYRVVHNGVDTGRFQPRDCVSARQELGLPLPCFAIGVFANFKRQKNHAMLFRAFRRVLDSLPDTRLLLVGEQPVDSKNRLDGYMAYLSQLVDDLGIRHRCMFLGHQKDVERLYPACNITVLSSLHEGTPNVLLESMACSIPVVATNVCDNQYIVREGETGYLVGTGDEVAMANRIKTLLSNAVLQQEMGCAARKWVLQEFSIGRLAQKTEAVYLEMLHRKTALRQHRIVEGSAEE